MTTITDLVNTIERDASIQVTRPEYDVTAASYSASSTTSTIQLDNTETLLPGAILNINMELMYVLEYVPNSRIATVKRAFLGTTGGAGAPGDLVRINPRFSDVAILDAITDELRSWDARLFAVQREALTFGASDLYVAATPTRAPYHLLDARKRPQTAFLALGTYWDQTRTHVPARLTQQEATAEFSTGYAVHLERPFGVSTTVDVFYALPFDLTGLTGTSNLESTQGLTAGMLEILKWGALWRLMAGRETTRSDQTVHGRPDLQQAVPAGVSVQIGQNYRRLRDEAFDKEARVLRGAWPYRFAG